MLTANRGLCGGYNASVLRLALHQLKELRRERAGGPRWRCRASGASRPSASARSRLDERFTQFEDKPSFDEVDVLANRYLEWYQAGRLDRLDVVYTQFESAQPAACRGGNAAAAGPAGRPTSTADERCRGTTSQYEFLPSAASIVDEVVPASFKVKLFKCFLDAAVSEQIARMVAMKDATENADAMIGSLSIAYNRARQGADHRRVAGDHRRGGSLE